MDYVHTCGIIPSIKLEHQKQRLLLNLEPFVAMIFGLLLLGIGIDLLQLLGAFVIVIGVTISLRTRSHSNP